MNKCKKISLIIVLVFAVTNVFANSNEYELTDVKEFRHGGARENAGRKLKFSHPLKFQIRVTQEEKGFISFARENHLNYSTLMQK